MVVEAHLDPRMELYHNTEEATGGNIRAGGVIPPSNHPCVILSHMTGKDQIIQ